MHASEVPTERLIGMANTVRSELSEPMQALTQVIAANAILHANGDTELETDFVGSNVGFAISIMISIIGEKFPHLMANPISCITNWSDSIQRGMNVVGKSCSCPHCKEERL